MLTKKKVWNLGTSKIRQRFFSSSSIRRIVKKRGPFPPKFEKKIAFVRLKWSHLIGRIELVAQNSIAACLFVYCTLMILALS